jgi:hypothetical protein
MVPNCLDIFDSGVNWRKISVLKEYNKSVWHANCEARISYKFLVKLAFFKLYKPKGGQLIMTNIYHIYQAATIIIKLERYIVSIYVHPIYFHAICDCFTPGDF